MTQSETQQQTANALTVFCALATVQNEQYTHFIGQFKHGQKDKFNNLIKTIAKNANPDVKKQVEDMTEYMHEFIFTLIKGEEAKVK